MSSVIKLKSKPINLKTELGEEFYSEAEKEINTQQTQKQELQLHYEKAYREGYENARKELQSEMDTELIKKSEEFYTILSSFESKLAEYDTSLPEVISKVSVMIAEKIITRELENKSIIIDNIKKAVRKIVGADEILIKINPKDYELLNTKNGISFIDTSSTKVKFEITEQMEQGGCLIESEIGNVDARISSQVEEVERIFQNRIANMN